MNEATFSDYPEFLKATNNSVVSAFESTRGRGLAGFITQMSLEYDGATWETKWTQRAPKWVEITLSYSPIHDLPLGLDYNGNMMAASHPVGLAYTDPYSSLLQEADESESDAAAGDQPQAANSAPIEAMESKEGSKEDTVDKEPTMPPTMGSMGMGGYAAIGAAVAGGVGLAKELLGD